jgi:membrane fusion protein
MKSLFRPEVLEARRRSWLGGISLVQPLRLWVLGGAAIAAAMAVVALAVLGSYTERTTVSGELVPDLGLSIVLSPADGVVAGLLPEEGAQVQAGDLLAQLHVPRTIADGTDVLEALRHDLDTRSDSTRALGQSQVQQVDEQKAGLNRRLEAARSELRLAESATATRRERVRIGRQTLDSYQSLAEENLVSQLQLNQQRQAVLELVDAAQASERQATQVRSNIAQLEQALGELASQRSGLVASTRRDLAALQMERVRSESGGRLQLQAPVAGSVANRLVEAGQSVQAGQPLLRILPRGSRLQAELLVPSRAIGFMDPGDRVQLRYHAYPYQKFGHHTGRVVRIARSAVKPAGSGSAPLYRVLVELDSQSITAYGRPEPLRPGMALDADVLGARRKLYEWVMEPLYSVTGRLGS